ncbi:Xylose isomerase domain protein TIM barrel [Operophtera brumata]|uniref:Xylose isomerase domain protein TIM barrel n=1 Tax=Operophtera brumata TaxID=104452 RepID=A0A0L7LQL7_OPEBR|nr:Xylose isomerase domain protein TIM barrel [Operophtera brumata]
MARDFIYDLPQRPSTWSRVSSTLNRWAWGALCCGLPGIPCYFCTCCEKLEDTDRDRPRVNPVRCALSQLQGDSNPLPTTPESPEQNLSEPG